MARYTCQRCKVTCNTTNEPHLCKDLAKRLARQEKIARVVAPLLMGYPLYATNDEVVEITLAITKAISRLDLGVE